MRPGDTNRKRQAKQNGGPRPPFLFRATPAYFMR